MSGIRDILIISTPDDIKNYSNLIGDGQNFGINVSYEIQPSPDGIAQALTIAENFLANQPSALMLADNIFYGDGLESKLVQSSMRDSSTVFSYKVHDPERFGICEIDGNNRVISLEEKPAKPKSNLAVTGLYFYDSNAPQIAKNIEPSNRGELEITDVNIKYMESNNLYSEVLDDSYKWIDAGTQESFLMASNYVKSVEDKTGMKILCPEEVAFKKGFISSENLNKIAEECSNSEYGKYLKRVIS
tara:strand:- start:756 stop:1490 length:735 start_codon:yes stop_codon:yes gene_type:complete